MNVFNSSACGMCHVVLAKLTVHNCELQCLLKRTIFKTERERESKNLFANSEGVIYVNYVAQRYAHEKQTRCKIFTFYSYLFLVFNLVGDTSQTQLLHRHFNICVLFSIHRNRNAIGQKKSSTFYQLSESASITIKSEVNEEMKMKRQTDRQRQKRKREKINSFCFPTFCSTNTANIPSIWFQLEKRR